jgi:hypothetical protein
MSIDVVAVDLDPIVWAVQCGLCGYSSENTQDGTLADELYKAHCAIHNLPDDSE